MRTTLAWLWFAVVQLVSLLATVVGWFLLIPFCLTHAWKPGPQSIKDTRVIDVWAWGPLNLVYGNPEDGVSGFTALVNGDQHYMPGAWWPWRAYCWSAWRNSADGLKYLFAWKAGPYKHWTLFGRPQHIGWQIENGFNVPVISL